MSTMTSQSIDKREITWIKAYRFFSHLDKLATLGGDMPLPEFDR